MISILITRCLNTSEIVLFKLFVVGYISFAIPENDSATNKIERIIREPAVRGYGSDDGLLEHREALLEKVNSLFIN